MMKAVVISNEKNVIEEVRKELEREGMVVLPDFNEHNKFLYQLFKGEIDMVFWDVETEETQGWEVAKKIKERKLKTQVVFITGINSAMRKALELAAADYVVKPLCKKQLAATIENMIKKTNSLL